MKNRPSSVLNMIKTTSVTFVKVLPALLLYEIIYRFLCFSIFRPLLSGILQSALNISGLDMVFNGDIASVYTNPSGIIGTIILCILAALLTYFEFASMILMIFYRYGGNPLSLPDSMKMALTTFKSLRSPGFIGFIIYTLGLLPLIGFGMAPSIRPSGDIPNFISGELYKSVLGSVLMVIFYVIMYLLFFCAIFILPSMILRRNKFGRAFRMSLSLIINMKLRDALPVILLFILWCVLFAYPGIVPTYYAGISDSSFAEILGNFFFSWKGILHYLLVEGLQIVLRILLFTFLVALYRQAGGKVSLNEKAMPGIDEKLKKTQKVASRIYGVFRTLARKTAAWIQSLAIYQKHKKPIWIFLCILIFLGIFGILYNQPNTYDQVVVGHRGSQAGVENTLTAVKGAVDAGADYAEVDILLSKDNVPMVIHDDDLKRLTGENLKVYDLTASQLSKLTLNQDGKKGTISTLDKVIDYSRGKINLLIELKLHGKEKADIVKQVTKVIEENHFQKNCQIMSLEYDLVEKLKTSYPEYITGYCVYGNLGNAKLNALRSLNVDFLVIEESMASQSFISQCNKAWLPVYVWTVNEKQSMESCLKMGASGIITDKPETARKVMNQFKKNSM